MTKKEKIAAAVLCIPLGFVWLAMHAPDTDTDTGTDTDTDTAPPATNAKECLARAVQFGAYRWPFASGGKVSCSGLWPSNDLGRKTEIASDMACDCRFQPDRNGEWLRYWLSAEGPLVGYEDERREQERKERQ